MNTFNYNKSNNKATANNFIATDIFKLFIVFVSCMTFSHHAKGQGNYIGFNTAYYDSFGILYSNEVGEDVAVNPSNGDYYVAGEYAKGTANQGIHIIRYNSFGGLLSSANFNIPGKRESVKRVLVYSTSVYLICNSLDDSTGLSSLLMIRCSNDLSTISPTYFGAYHDPSDACITSLTGMYVSCYKRTGSSDELAVLKLGYYNTTLFSILNSYVYHYSNVSDNYQENPKQMVYYSGSIYVAGGTVDNTTGNTGTLAIKLNTSLAQQWAKASIPAVGVYVYNTVAVTSTNVYVAGGTKNNGENMWQIKRLDNTTGNKIIGAAFDAGSNFTSQALKITLADASNVIVVGYAQNTSLNTYKVEIGKYAADLSGTPSYYSTSLLNGSKITDAVSKSNGITYITGQKYVGGIQGNKYMFFYGFSVLNGGSNFYRDSLVNQNSCGNKIAMDTYSNGGIAAVAGFKNNNSNAAQPTDFNMTTRFYEEVIPRVADEITHKQELTFSISPNPASDFINISATESIQSYNVIDMQGRILLHSDLGEDLLTKDIDISSLHAGIYFITINNGKAQRLIKR